VKNLAIRRATPADAATIAGIQVRGSQWAYRGLLPDASLDRPSKIAEREAAWRPQLAPDDPRHTWIAEADGAALGFVTCGPADDPALPGATGEVYAIYQEPYAAGSGVGGALFSHALAELRARGFKLAVLWVLAGNHRARRFYERFGWTADGATKEVTRTDHVRHEVRYRGTLP
jgi:GNAT superfamily N-acetyltransferase